MGDKKESYIEICNRIKNCDEHALRIAMIMLTMSEQIEPFVEKALNDAEVIIQNISEKLGI